MFHGAHGYGYVYPVLARANQVLTRGRSCIVMVAPEIIIGSDAQFNLATRGNSKLHSSDPDLDDGKGDANSLSSQAGGGMLILVTEFLSVSNFAEFLCGDPEAIPTQLQDAIAARDSNGQAFADFRGAEAGCVLRLNPATGEMTKLI